MGEHLEEAVVRARREPAGHLDVVVEGPEVLDRGHGDDGPLVLLPGPSLVVLEEPEGPGVLQRVLQLQLKVQGAGPGARLGQLGARVLGAAAGLSSLSSNLG